MVEPGRIAAAVGHRRVLQQVRAGRGAARRSARRTRHRSRTRRRQHGGEVPAEHAASHYATLHSISLHRATSNVGTVSPKIEASQVESKSSWYEDPMTGPRVAPDSPGAVLAADPVRGRVSRVRRGAAPRRVRVHGGLRVQALIDHGYLREADDGQPRGGRRPRRLTLRPDSGEVVAVDLGSNHATSALFDMSGTRSSREHRAPVRIAEGSRRRAGLGARRGRAACDGPADAAARHHGRRAGTGRTRGPGGWCRRRGCRGGTASTCARCWTGSTDRAGAGRQRREPHGARRALRRPGGPHWCS